jgi:hypothetical protein
MVVLRLLIVERSLHVSRSVKHDGILWGHLADRTSLAGFSLRNPTSLRNRKNDLKADFDRLREIIALGLPAAVWVNMLEMR